MDKDNNPACVLWGAYGNKNIGDQLTLAVALHDARSRYGDSVAVLSGASVYTQWNFPDVRVIPYVPLVSPISNRGESEKGFYNRLRQQFSTSSKSLIHNLLGDKLKQNLEKKPSWVQAISRSSQLYLVGGGYLNSIFKLDRFLLPIQCANFFSVPIATAPLGLGPFHSEIDGAKVAQCLRNAEVLVRDRSSLEFCRSNCITASLRQDDGFRALEVFADLPRLANLVGIDSNLKKQRPLIGVCIFYQHDPSGISKAERWWLSFLETLQQFDVDLEGFCFNPANGLEFSTMIKLFSASGWDIRRVKPPTLDFRTAVYSLSRYDVIVSTRFHPIVLAKVLGISSVAFALGKYYSNKMSSILCSREINCRLINPDKDTPEEITKYVMTLC